MSCLNVTITEASEHLNVTVAYERKMFVQISEVCGIDLSYTPLVDANNEQIYDVNGQKILILRG